MPSPNGSLNLLKVVFWCFLNPHKMNNDQFYKLHKKIGANAIESRRKFVGMLPEAYKRGLHMRKPFNGSIHHYGNLMGGLSREQVSRVLNLEGTFQDKPALHNLLVSGKVSHHKLARVASVATRANEEELAAKCSGNNG